MTITSFILFRVRSVTPGVLIRGHCYQKFTQRLQSPETLLSTSHHQIPDPDHEHGHYENNDDEP
ncbi:hypothetical protein BJX65DRAFT_272266 [Aspergillus insuetus]